MIWGSVSELVLHVMLAGSPLLAFSVCSSIRRTMFSRMVRGATRSSWYSSCSE